MVLRMSPNDYFGQSSQPQQYQAVQPLQFRGAEDPVGMDRTLLFLVFGAIAVTIIATVAIVALSKRR